MMCWALQALILLACVVGAVVAGCLLVIIVFTICELILAPFFDWLYR